MDHVDRITAQWRRERPLRELSDAEEPAEERKGCDIQVGALASPLRGDPVDVIHSPSILSRLESS